MELNVSEINYSAPLHSTFERIPENSVPVKVIKKGVHFAETIKPIPKQNAKMVRPQVIPEKPKMSYEDILSKMGMFVAEGKLHLMEDNKQQYQQQQYQQQQYQQQQYQQQHQQQQSKYNIDQNIPQNSYIYNKYFQNKTETTNNIRRPLSLKEYRNMLILDALQKQKIKQIKSTKLIMPTSNINLAGGSANLNKLFTFSQR
jgi:hypothetical protein